MVCKEWDSVMVSVDVELQEKITRNSMHTCQLSFSNFLVFADARTSIPSIKSQCLFREVRSVKLKTTPTISLIS